MLTENNFLQLYSAKFTDLQIDGTRANAIDAHGNSVTQVSIFFNHNCYHNSGRVFTDGAKMFTFATRPIKKNEQVINYQFMLLNELINLNLLIFKYIQIIV